MPDNPPTEADTITVVCGFPRSGSSLMMRMLEAGGMRVVCDNRNSYEDDRVLDLPARPLWLRECWGAAVKVLDPQHYVLPEGPAYRFIWMDRDRRQQALSQIKFTRAAFPMVQLTSDAVSSMEQSLRDDVPRAITLLRCYPGSTLLRISFEQVLADTLDMAVQVNEFCGGGLDEQAMVGVVVKRSPACYPGLMELEVGHAD